MYFEETDSLVNANLAWTAGWVIALARRVLQGPRVRAPKLALRDDLTAFGSPMRRCRLGGAL